MTTTIVPAVVTSPWMTVAEAAAYSRRGMQTVYRALREYRSTRGRRGLRGSQTEANCCWRVRVTDVDAWLAGDAPKRRNPR